LHILFALYCGPVGTIKITKHLLHIVDENLGTGTETALTGSFHVTDILSTVKTWLCNRNHKFLLYGTCTCSCCQQYWCDQVIKASCLLLSSLHVQDANTYIWSTVLCWHGQPTDGIVNLSTVVPSHTMTLVQGLSFHFHRLWGAMLLLSSASMTWSQLKASDCLPGSSPRWANLSWNWLSRFCNLSKRWYMSFWANAYNSRSSAFSCRMVSNWSGRIEVRVALDKVALFCSKGTANLRLNVSSKTYWLT